MKTPTPTNPLISFSAVEKNEIINWENVVKQFIAFPPSIDDEEYTKYMELANSWGTCPCGQLPNVLKRYDEGDPKDDQLRQWGTLFTNNFVNQEFEEAKRFLDRIMLRLPVVLAQEKYERALKVIELQEAVADLKAQTKKVQVELAQMKALLKGY